METARTHRFIVTALIALSVGACASTPLDTAPPPAEAPAPTDFAPRPYTIKDLQRALKVGSEISLRMEDAAGAVSIHESTVTEVTAETITFKTLIRSTDGNSIQDAGTQTQTWSALRDEAAFPAAHTVRSEGSLTVPVGVHDTWLYVVTSKDNDGKSVESYYTFAKTLPGPPIQSSVVVDGKIVSKSTMVGRR